MDSLFKFSNKDDVHDDYDERKKKRTDWMENVFFSPRNFHQEYQNYVDDVDPSIHSGFIQNLYITQTFTK